LSVFFLEVVMKLLNFTIPKTHKPLTLEAFLSNTHISKSLKNRLVYEKKVMVNGTLATKDVWLKPLDLVSIDLSMVNYQEVKQKDCPIEVLYEDDFIVCVYKPMALLVYSDQFDFDTLTNRVKAYYQNQNHPFEVLPAHRLDFDTSGIVIFAKNPLSLSYLSYLFETNQIEKYYLAKIEGHIEPSVGTISGKIANDRHSQKMRIGSNGKEALTTYRVINKSQSESLLEIKIKGGRKHQIRVHMAFLGHPIKGDKLYGNSSKRLYLHFYRTSFKDLFGQLITIETKNPF